VDRATGEEGAIRVQWNWIHRTIFPLINQPSPVNTFGLGDIQYQGYLSPAQPGKLIWGVGPVLQVPSATDQQLGTGKWSAGPGAVVLHMDGPWVPDLCQPDAVPALSQLQPGAGTGHRVGSDH
jgi:hypothetical protein